MVNQQQPEAVAGSRSVLIAPDKFKGSATAVEVAAALAAGLRKALPGVRTVELPVADGGDGTVDAAVAAGYARHTVTVSGPTGEPVRAAFALGEAAATGAADDSALPAPLAVLEMAEASGLRRLPEGRPAPLTATTYGTGELIAAALDAGARTIVLGVGGSATTDGGAGMLSALGARLLDADGRDLPPGGAALRDLRTVDLSGLDPRLGRVRIVLAADVDNPLLGEDGAAAVYGPQKGATPADVALLDAALGRFAEVVGAATGTDLAGAPGAGAAGGIGYGVLAVLGGTRRSGIEMMLEVTGFAEELGRADLVVTGEGSMDRQTLHGKAPAGVAEAARRAGIPVVAVCGVLRLDAETLRRAGFARWWALADIEPDPRRSMAEAASLLEGVGASIAGELLTV
ncbi:glycerate kinase [Allostreptomyces psammosilenae]|uniref:Glycerate kinase n=1 Tax=Allostreptomyces psammosilenae TaxID=1892865 RepID=A0A852ZNP3_9ACTN|nr:glycerate kinase [Allostreptomyces psammosilenae]NYI03295.1 glycerate kinase [Allostreptomyces psammosilenae]